MGRLAPLPPGWSPRRPEGSALYEAVRSSAASFVSWVESSGSDVPRYVRAELDGFVRCGVPAYGFARVHCRSCGDDFVVAFSCKGRGFCPSCGARRMTETAARWVDRLLPLAPYRQWVLTLPWWLRARLSWDTGLLTEVVGVLHAAVRRRLRQLGRHGAAPGLEPGAVTVVQRFGGALNLNVHVHALVSDGGWTAEGRFAPVRVRASDVASVAERVNRRLLGLLERRGLSPEGGGGDDGDDGQLVLALSEASAGLRVATGARAGQPVRRHRAPRGGPGTRQKKAMQASVGGVDIEASVRLSAADRVGLERVARYLLRPALALDRLRLRGDGLYEYALRRPWADGTVAVVLSAHELMEKLAALVPVPRGHLVRYHGVFAPNHRLRRVVVPRRTDGLAPCGRRPRGGLVPADGRAPWAQLLRRVWGTDVLRCATCGSRRVVIAVHEPGAATRILAWLGLDPVGPQLAAARAPPDDEAA